MACGYWFFGDSGSRAVHCCWTDYGSAGGCGNRRSRGRAVRALIGIGIPEYEAKQYETKIKGGNIRFRSTPRTAMREIA